MIQKFFETEYKVRYSESGALWIIRHYNIERPIRKSLPRQIRAVLSPTDIDNSPISVSKVETAVYRRFQTLYTPGYVQEAARKCGYKVTKKKTAAE